MRKLKAALIALAGMSTAGATTASAQNLEGIDPITIFENLPEPAHSGFETVNGLEMYCQVHGEGGAPLVLLHGGLMTIEALGPLLPALAETRTVYGNARAFLLKAAKSAVGINGTAVGMPSSSSKSV